MRRRPASLALALAVGLAVGVGCAHVPTGASPPRAEAPVDATALPPAVARLDALGLAPETLDTDGRGYALVRLPLDSGTALVQWIDLRVYAVEQSLGASAPDTLGVYHPSAPSPTFPVASTTVAVEAAARTGAQAVVNGVFFEAVGPERTRLSFPVAVGGRVVSGGTSRFGPSQPGADTTRWGRPLVALGFAGRVAALAPYDPATGAPLGAGPFADAFVSYAPTAHPSRRPTRYHVVGVWDATGDGVPETLIIVTSSGATTIDAPARLLTRLGVPPERQTTLDGGGSVAVWNRRAGWLERPRADRRVPHVLVVRRR